MTAYADFLADPGRLDLWVADLDPYDSGTGAEVTLRVSSDEYATEGGDTPAHTGYEARLVEPPNYETDAAPAGTLGQLPERRGGELKIGLRMGDRDAWRSYDWSGRRCVVHHGGYSPRLGRKLTYAEMGVAEYEMERALFGLDVATVPLRDPRRRFEDLLQTRRYMGTDFTLELDSSSSFVNCGNPSALNITGDMTFEGRFWFNTIPGAGASHAFMTWATGAATAWPFNIRLDGSAGTVAFQATGYAAALSSTGTLAAKTWYHVQITRAGTAITFRILAEATGGEAINTATASQPTGASRNGTYVVIGGETAVGFSQQRWIWDEVRVWSGARTEAQWRDFRGRALTAAEAADSTLKGYWRADNATGTAVTDSSATAAHGTISGTYNWLPSLQGKADLAGRVLPDGFGFVEDAAPVLVYEPTRIYQGHSRSASSVADVSEGGAALTLNTAYADWLSFLLATTTAAKYDTLICTDGTFIRLGSNPTKPLSMTFSGDASGSGYVSTAADITRRIITTRGSSPLIDPTDLDTTSYSDLNTANSSVIGLYFTEEISIEEATNRALASVGAVGWFGRTDRKHRVERFAGASGSPVITLTERDIISIEPIDAEQPLWEEVLLYRHNYSVLTVDQMAAGTITTARQAFLEADVRRLRRPNTATKTRHKYARTETVDTYFTTEAAAITEADRRLALFGGGVPRAYRIEAKLTALQLDRMDLVAIDYKDLSAAGAEQNRLGLNGVNFVVLAGGERSAERRATLTVWRES